MRPAHLSPQRGCAAWGWAWTCAAQPTPRRSAPPRHTRPPLAASAGSRRLHAREGRGERCRWGRDRAGPWRQGARAGACARGSAAAQRMQGACACAPRARGGAGGGQRASTLPLAAAGRAGQGKQAQQGRAGQGWAGQAGQRKGPLSRSRWWCSGLTAGGPGGGRLLLNGTCRGLVAGEGDVQLAVLGQVERPPAAQRAQQRKGPTISRPCCPGRQGRGVIGPVWRTAAPIRSLPCCAQPRPPGRSRQYPRRSLLPPPPPSLPARALVCHQTIRLQACAVAWPPFRPQPCAAPWPPARGPSPGPGPRPPLPRPPART